MKYYVSTVRTDAAGNLIFDDPRPFKTFAEARRAAKKLADANDCVTYGPESIAYVGKDVTAVLAWEWESNNAEV